jgi:hypothetical protein
VATSLPHLAGLPLDAARGDQTPLPENQQSEVGTSEGTRHGMKVRDVVRLLLNDGWVQVSQKGSHR